jgi:transcriptional regulator with XRE-family HTH domain
MQDAFELVNEVRQLALDSGFSVRGLARLSKLGINTLRNLRSDKWEPTITTLHQLQVTLKRLEDQGAEKTAIEAAELEIHPRNPLRYKPKNKRKAKAKAAPECSPAH